MPRPTHPYIPMKTGFVYLVAIIDWYTRRVLSWRVSNTLDTRFCVDALEEALASFEQPEIFNTDQGAQFTADAFTKRLWRSVKYEEVYLHAYEDALEARRNIGRYFDFYNERRPHQALGYQTPAAFYRGEKNAA
jgi:putative transposase